MPLLVSNHTIAQCAVLLNKCLTEHPLLQQMLKFMLLVFFFRIFLCRVTSRPIKYIRIDCMLSPATISDTKDLRRYTFGVVENQLVPIMAIQQIYAHPNPRRWALSITSQNVNNHCVNWQVRYAVSLLSSFCSLLLGTTLRLLFSPNRTFQLGEKL